MGNSTTKRGKCYSKCQQCGQQFRTSPSRIKLGNRFCSFECRCQSQRVRVEVKCLQCEKEFKVRPSEIAHGRGKYCSVQCKTLGKKKRIIHNCDYCGKPVETLTARLKEDRRKYCSTECSGLGHRGSKSHHWQGGVSHNYGSNWREQSKLVRQRDDNTCQYCRRKQRNGERKFPIHHIVKRRDFNGDYEAANALSNLILLCHNCHKPAELGKIALPVRLF
jgi:5-methylcytosine-specific restriction endonuclease McrA